MSAPERSGPRDFGEALKRTRTAAGVTLEAIVERTKLSRRVLEAFEAGEFGKLPSRTFARMFLRQVVEMLGESGDRWVAQFDQAWERHLQGSQVVHVTAIQPRRRRRVGPWIIGLLVVAVGVAAVLYLAGRNQGAGDSPTPPTPAALLPLLAPTPLPTPVLTPPPEPTPAPDPSALVIRAGEASCWVQVRIAGKGLQSRLLAGGDTWELPAGGQGVEIVLGDAGAIASVEYLGEAHVQLGRSGEVVRLTLPPRTPTSASPGL